MSGDAGGGHRYPDDEDEAREMAEPRLTRHRDHDPSLICRPAFGYGLCEVLGDDGVTPVREYPDGVEHG